MHEHYFELILQNACIDTVHVMLINPTWSKICYFHDRTIIASKMCLKYKVEGRQQGRKQLKNEEVEIEKRRRKLGLSSTGPSKGPKDY